MDIKCKFEGQNVNIVNVQIEGYMIYITYINKHGDLKKATKKIPIYDEDYTPIATECEMEKLK